MNTIEEILSYVAPIPEIKIEKRNSYIIIGKPGCGKTTLATKLSEITRSQLVNFDTALQFITSDESEKSNKVILDEKNIFIILVVTKSESRWCSWRRHN